LFCALFLAVKIITNVVIKHNVVAESPAEQVALHKYCPPDIGRIYFAGRGRKGRFLRDRQGHASGAGFLPDRGRLRLTALHWDGVAGPLYGAARGVLHASLCLRLSHFTICMPVSDDNPISLSPV